VDIGLIGYQDATCNDGEHILFDGIHLDIIDEEAVITSTLKSIDPVIRYHSGDKVERLSEKKFKLLGRKNRLLTVWGARITAEQIVQAANEVGVDNIQIHVYYGSSKTDVLDIWTEQSIDQSAFIKTLLEICKDLRQSVSKEFVREHLVFSTSAFIRNSRTGKTPLLLDKRL
jgi:phenylacetate-coenzyme A ligase PaaK-like adenylate-forming protein